MAKAYYVLALLTLVWAFQFANIHIVNIVLERIRSEFQQSDTVMGLIAGIAVVLFGSILSMPVARLADRKGRIAIISIGVTFWSIMTTLGGFAQSIVQLLLARVGYSIGGSVSPGPGNSLAADYFPRNKLPMAMAIMSTAPCIGGLIAAWIGGIAGTNWGWRGAFIAVGIPGFIIAALLYFTVKEPVRGIQDGKHADTRDYGVGETLRFFLENKTYFLMVIGFTFTGFADLALSTWFVTYLERVHQKTMLEASTFGGTLSAIGSLAGVLLGGVIIGYLGKKNDRWKIVGPGITSLLAAPVLVAFLFAPMPWAYVARFLLHAFDGLPHGPDPRPGAKRRQGAHAGVCRGDAIYDRHADRIGRRAAADRRSQRLSESGARHHGDPLFAALRAGGQRIRRSVFHLGRAVRHRGHPQKPGGIIG